MNRRMKVLILVLLTAALCLSAAIASLRMNETETETASSEAAPAAEPQNVALFNGKDGLWGARTANGRVLIAPTWFYLRKMSETVLVARRSGGKNDRFGLIRMNGEQLIPFLYDSIAPADPGDSNVWLAAFSENGTEKYHLYRPDGTRWMDETWDSCSYQDGILDITKGQNRYACRLTRKGIEWLNRYEEFPVGLHKLVLDFDSTEMAQMPPADTISGLGEAAAVYLRYLFITKKPPDSSLLGAENAVRSDYDYDNCRLLRAEVSRIRVEKTDGLPCYLMQIQTEYLQSGEGPEEHIKTALMLTISRNLAGAYIYSGFTDSRQSATRTDLLESER